VSKKQPVREIEYASLSEMLADVESMLANGYVSHGNWSLGQASGHVAEWMSYPIDGFPKPPWFMRAIFGVMKATGMCQRMANKILAEGFKPGMPTAPDTVPDSECDDREGVAKLRRVVNQTEQFSGELHLSPLFGKIDMATHVRVSLLHAQHHFGYLKPNQSD